MLKYLKNNNNYIKPTSLIFVLLFFLAVTVFFFRGIIFSQGLVVSSDWSIPLTFHQMEIYIERQFYTWTYDMTLFGVKNPFFVSMPFVLLVKIFLLLGLNGEILSKALIIIVFTLSGFSMYLLLRFLGLKKLSSIIGGYIFITMPVFFDYAIMGWCFVLFAVGTILPITVICLIKSVEEEKIRYSIISGLLFSIAMIQSQSLVWFPMVFFALFFYFVKNKLTLLAYLKSILIVVFLALVLHISWWPNLILNQDLGVMNSDLVLDSISMGMRMRLNLVNILRGWGGLFNYQYEVSYPVVLMPLSFLITFMAIASLLLRKIGKRDIRIPLVVIVFYMIILFLIDPSILAKIPLTNLIRDTGRFTALTSFSYTILASFFWSYLFESSDKKKKLFAYFFLGLIFLNSYSFFSGKLYGEPESNGEEEEKFDTRLRTYRFPDDYSLAENYLYTIKKDVKSYYPPSGTNIAPKDNSKFDVGFKEIKDPFRAYSPIPGSIYMYYSSIGKPPVVNYLLDSLFDENHFEKSLWLMGMMNIEDFVIRKDINYPKGQISSIQSLLSNAEGNNLIDFGKVQILRNKYFLPHFYIPSNILYSNVGVDDVVDVYQNENNDYRFAFYNEDIYKSELKPNEIILKSKLLDKIENEETISGKGFNSQFLPYVNQKPGTLIYWLTTQKEEFEKWKTKKNPEEYIDFKLFFAGKRIAELNKFYRPTFNNLFNEFEPNYFSTRERYYIEMQETLSIINNIKSQNNPEYLNLLEKFNTILAFHQKSVEKMNGNLGLNEIFFDLESKSNELMPKHDLLNQSYSLNIPLEGEYDVHIYKDGIRTLLDKKYFQKGLQSIIIPITRISGNLINKNLEIASYLPVSIYQISFEYNTPKPFIFTIKENNSDKDLFRKPLSSTDDNNYQRFEAFFKSSLEGTSAAIHFVPDNNGKIDLKYQNLQVKRIYEPEVILKSVNNINEINGLTDYEKTVPKITFVKINPTKYRVKVQGAKDPYALVFSESFHEGWKAYLRNDKCQMTNDKCEDNYGETVASYFNGDIKEGTHRNTFLEKATFETLGKKPITEDRHLLVNGYANSWYITPEDTGRKENYELIIEFAPQRLFYIGLFVSFLTLVSCLGYLIIAKAKNLWKRNS